MRTLNELKAGEASKIKWMFGGREFLEAIHRCGIAEGSSVCVLQKLWGGLIIGCNERRFAIGDELAACIKV